MEPQHERTLKDILSKSEEEFTKWVGGLSDKEIDYVSWLLEEAHDTLDEILLEQYGLVEAQRVLDKIK